MEEGRSSRARANVNAARDLTGGGPYVGPIASCSLFFGSDVIEAGMQITVGPPTGACLPSYITPRPIVSKVTTHVCVCARARRFAGQAGSHLPRRGVVSVARDVPD